MNISWVVADNIVLDPLADVVAMKEIGPIWGSWRTWRSCATDNVICHTHSRAEELIKRGFATSCNFYIPNSIFAGLNRPDNVRLYEGSFVDDFQPEEIVAIHLAATASDIVLLLGFDWCEVDVSTDKLVAHRQHVYRTLVKSAINSNPTVQWVLVDHTGDIMPALADLPNLTKDTMAAALSLLNT